jgi:hypothetical protein
VKAIGLPVTILVAIVIAVIVIAVAIVMMGPLSPLGEKQALEGYLTSCCTSYRLNGNCAAPDPAFECTLSPQLGGKISISELAGRLGGDVDTRCCR